MGLEQLADIDARILKEDYRNYDLVARYWKGAYRGKIWQRKKAVASIQGGNLDTVYQQLRDKVDSFVDSKRSSRGTTEPTAREIADAFTVIESKLTPSQMDMLAAHCSAADHCLSLIELQKAGKYPSSTQAMLAYADIGNRLMDELGYVPQTGTHQDPSIFILIEATIQDSETLIDRWKLRHPVAEAVENLLESHYEFKEDLEQEAELSEVEYDYSDDEDY